MTANGSNDTVTLEIIRASEVMLSHCILERPGIPIRCCMGFFIDFKPLQGPLFKGIAFLYERLSGLEGCFLLYQVFLGFSAGFLLRLPIEAFLEALPCEISSSGDFDLYKAGLLLSFALFRHKTHLSFLKMLAETQGQVV